ncbi:MAG: anti-sigma factor [Blastocatellia bacterium]
MNWDEVKELAPLYVIGALDVETERAIEVSLRDATLEQRQDIAQWCEVAALLPLALPDQTPPDELKERLLSRIANEAQQTPIEIAVGESIVEERVEKLAEQAEKKILPFVPARRAESKTTRWLLIAATALLAFTSAYLFGQNAKLAREREEISQENARLAREREEISQELDTWKHATTKIIAMTGVEIPQANAKVVWDTKTQRWVVYIFDLPAPPSDKQYQLWYVTKEAKISARVFSTDTQGRSVLRLELPPEALAGLAATAVTIEPKGGSPQPTGKFYLHARI